MNFYQQRHETRIRKIQDLFHNNYCSQIDDFYDARDQLLKDIEEVFLNYYDVNFKAIAIDTELTNKEARNVLREIGKKLV